MSFEFEETDIKIILCVKLHSQVTMKKKCKETHIKIILGVKLHR